MDMAYQRRRRGGGDGTLAILVGALTLAGCSLGSGIDSSDGSASFGSRFSNLFSGAKPGVSQPASPTPSAPEFECPGVDIRPGASTLNIAAKAAQATAGDLRYQLSFGQTARECSVQAGNMSIKVGVQGRVIVGPMGGAGVVDVPLRYAVVREGPQPRTITTRFKRVAVSVAPEQTHVQFVDIEEGLTFPLPGSTELDAYVIYVGFDEMGDRNEKKSEKAAKKPTQRQP
jgi:hypothetical protein